MEVGKLQGRQLKTAVTDRNSIRLTLRRTGTTRWPMSSHSIEGQASLDVPHRALLERTSLGKRRKDPQKRARAVGEGHAKDDE